MRNPITLTASAWAFYAAATILQADVVETNDGSRLMGEIAQISDGVLHLETAYAGKLEIPMSEVATFSSDEAESVRLANGNVAVGPVSGGADGSISIATSGGNVSASTSDVVATWTPGERDPDAVAREAELEGQLRKWAYSANIGISGSSGNTTKSDYAGDLSATLEGPNDRLNMYLSYNYATAETVIDATTGETDNEATSDELIGGISYTSFFTEHFGWYVREELERDRFENISFRSTSAAGLNYRAINTDTRNLEFTAGLSLRYEGYDDGTSSESFPGLDFGLKHYWKITEWAEMNNTLTYNPAFDDLLGDYRIDHLSTLDLPLGTADYWKLRLSLANQYSSNPTGELDNLDTTYGLSLLLNWK